MPFWVCKTCQERFKRHKNGDREFLFCSQGCYHKWRNDNNIRIGCFKKGSVPWSKGTKGLVKANRGSFKKGEDPINKTPIGTIKIRNHRGTKRVWIKVKEDGNPYDWMVRAVYVWTKKHGPIPRGYIIHHKNRDTLDDSLCNLELLSRAEHLMEHRYETEEKRKLRASIASKRRHAANRLTRKQNS